MSCQFSSIYCLKLANVSYIWTHIFFLGRRRGLTSLQKMMQYHLCTQQVLNKYLVMMMTMIGPSPEIHLPLKGRTRYEALNMGLGGAGRNSPNGSPHGRQQLTQPSSNSGWRDFPHSKTEWEILSSYPWAADPRLFISLTLFIVILVRGSEALQAPL